MSFPKEIIILAGGLATRLGVHLGQKPKCLAPIDTKPFLYHQIQYFLDQGIQSFIFALGKGHEQVVQYLERSWPELAYQLHIETEPLGTGGAVKACLALASDNTVWVANGDSFLDARLEPMASFHHMCGAACTLALADVPDCMRYGKVELGNDYRIRSFYEKGTAGSGLVNAGIYLLNRRIFHSYDVPGQSSLERDFLQKYVGEALFYGYRHRGFFIDIGTPEDLQRAQNEWINHDI
jgi:D-glycero-alpha-D-manno-heptose 1-phosphate guanylyltransferase